MLTASPPQDARASAVRFEGSKLVVTLTDGRQIAVPIEWFPRLAKATEAQRLKYRLFGRGRGIHWSDIDEDISVAGLLGAAA